MFSYPQLRDVGILTSHDVSNLARQLHTHYRLDRVDKEVLPHVKTLITDIQNGKVPGNPLASVHILSCLKEMEEFDLADDFWKWLEPQNEDHTDARVYGAAIECLAYQGTALDVMEDLYTEALERYSDSTVATVARDTGKELESCSFKVLSRPVFYTVIGKLPTKASIFVSASIPHLPLRVSTNL